MQVNTDFAPLYRDVAALPDLAIAAIEPGDHVITHGTQARVAVPAGAG